MAVLGQSGSGKTSFLNALSFRIPYKRSSLLTGSVLLNGKQMNGRKMAKVSAFVEQESFLFNYLTVEETLILAAKFNLGPEKTEEDIQRCVNDVMTELGLVKVANSRVGGGDTQRGISGGERKRVAIAKELFSNPKILFLDEPTSGLDSFQALSVMDSMRNMVMKSNRLIITVIHQPRGQIFEMTDKCFILSEGQTMFYGPTSLSVDYFDSIGFSLPKHCNPADYFLDNMSVDTRTVEREHNSRTRIDAVAKLWMEEGEHSNYKMTSITLCDVSSGSDSSDHDSIDGNRSNEIIIHGDTELNGDIHGTVLIRRTDDHEHELQEKKQGEIGIVEKENIQKQKQKQQKTLSKSNATTTTTSCSQSCNDACKLWWRDFAMLLWRASIDRHRNWTAITVRFITILFFAVLLSLVYSDMGDGQQSIQDRVGILFFISINQSFGPLAENLNTFPDEKSMVSRELTGGAYTLSAYYLSRVVSEVPLNILFPIIYSTIIYWSVGLNSDPYRYLVFIAVIVLETHCAVATGYMISVLAPSSKAAQAFGPPILIILILFGGFYINTDTLPAGSEWVQYISFIRWSFQALLINEFTGRTFDCDDFPGCEKTGSDVLTSLSFANQDLYTCVWALVVIMLSAFFLAYLLLLLNSTKQMQMLPNSNDSSSATIRANTTVADISSSNDIEELSRLEDVRSSNNRISLCRGIF